MIHVLREKASPEQIEDMRQALGSSIKLAVDIRLGVLAGGGAMHAHCQAALDEAGSQHESIWGATWYPATGEIKFRSQINDHPGNRGMIIQEPEVRKRIEGLVRRILCGIMH